jgi:L-iditol 2-dehydrogenase
MKIAELVEHRVFRLGEDRLADPGPGDVQVRVHAVGICGSDVHYFSEGTIGDTVCVYPMVLGHEPTGEIVKTGAGVSGWSAGDHAVLEPAIYCYHCEYCLSGHHNVCANLKFLSTPGTPGFFREFVNLPAKSLMPIPRPMDMMQSTLFEPLAVVLHSLSFTSVGQGETVAVFGAGPIGLLTVAALKLKGAGRVFCVEPLAVVLHSLSFTSVGQGETVAVFGAGPIGLLTVAALKLKGAGRVFCVEPLAHRRELALQMGADAVIDPRAVDAVKQIVADTGKRGVDAAFDCATKEDTVNQCLDVARNAGCVVVTGIPSELQVKLNFHTMRRKELFFFSVRRSNHETEEALTMMRERPTLFGPLVTHTRPLDKIQEAFEMLERYDEGIGKLVLTF